MQQVQNSKTCITLKRNLRIYWKFGNKLILSISCDQCRNNIISESLNGPLKGYSVMHTRPHISSELKCYSQILCGGSTENFKILVILY